MRVSTAEVIKAAGEVASSLPPGRCVEIHIKQSFRGSVTVKIKPGQVAVETEASPTETIRTIP